MQYKFAKRFDGITGSAIRAIFSLLADPNIISFAGGNPSPQTFPKEDLADAARELLLRQGDTILQYGSTVGRPALLNTVRELLAQEGYSAQDNEIITLTGSSQGLEMMTKILIDPGDTVLVEAPTFLGALQTFKTYEANLVEIEMDEFGIIPESLERNLQKTSAKFLYTIPTFQNPTGRTLPLARRKQVYELCRRYGCLILEDDPYMALRYEGEALPGIKSFDTENEIVVKLLSFSKTISPGLRIGAAYGNAEIIHKFNLAKQGIDVHTPNLTQELVSEYIAAGHYNAHIANNCDLYREKCTLMYSEAVKHFPQGTKIIRPAGGMFLWAELPEQYNCTELFETAVKAGVAYVPGTYFYAQGGHHNTLRMNFTMVSAEKIREGMQRLAKVFS